MAPPVRKTMAGRLASLGRHGWLYLMLLPGLAYLETWVTPPLRIRVGDKGVAAIVAGTTTA